MVFLQAALTDQFSGFLLSMPWGAVSISKFWPIVSIIISSVTSPFTSLTPCTRRQFLLEYCSCWSACFSSFENWLDKDLTSNWRFPIISLFFASSSSYSLNLSEINWTESCKSFSCFSPLICYSWVDFAKTKISFICFSTFLKQLKIISTHVGDFKRSAKISSDISFKLLMLLFSNLIFFGPFPFFDWSLRPRPLFFDDLSKYFVILFDKDSKNNFILILRYTNKYYNNMIICLLWLATRVIATLTLTETYMYIYR